MLDGSARITLIPTQDLDQFNLDLRDWFAVSRVAVGKHPAAYFQEDGQELVIAPRPKLHAGRTYTVHVDYSGVPETVIDPDGSSEGWVKNQDGAFVVNEPQGSPGWFPVNDDPNDKATYDFAITVPAGNVAIGNGVLLSSVTDGGRTTWRWREDSPMASYLTTATNGDFDLTTAMGPNGLPIYNAVDSKGDSAATDGFSAANKATIAQRLALQPQIISVLSDLWGPYPFKSAGAVIDRGHVNYALESQTKPMYDGVPSLTTIVHERRASRSAGEGRSRAGRGIAAGPPLRDNPPMADHTIVNLLEVEDAAKTFGMPAGLEARFARSALGLEKCGVTLFEAGPGFQVPWGHRHRDQEEVYLVLRGSATVAFGDGETAELREWDAVRIPADVARSFKSGPDGAEVLAFGAGEQGDAEMIQDFW